MRLPAPVFGAAQEMKYRELHTGLPVVMRVCMEVSRLSMFCVLQSLFSAMMVVSGGSPIMGMAGIALSLSYGLVANSSIDIFRIGGAWMLMGIMHWRER